MTLTKNQIEKITNYRKVPYRGISIDLVPLGLHNLDAVTKLRNQEHSKYYLNQQFDLTLDDQKKWFDKYQKRLEDIYWCIANKENQIVGTVRLYDITQMSCEHGSFIVDQQYTMGTPYALEAMILSLDFAFEVLELKNVECNDRHDNTNMNSITRRFGFKYDKINVINGVEYNHYNLMKDDYDSTKYKNLLKKFMSKRCHDE